MIEITLKDGSKQTYNNYSEMFSDKEAMSKWIPAIKVKVTENISSKGVDIFEVKEEEFNAF